MDNRIMQRVAQTTQPLSFSPNGANTLLLDSASTPWAGVRFEVHRSIPGELRNAGPLAGECGIAVFLEGTLQMTLLRGGREISYRAIPGSTTFMAGEEEYSARVTGSAVLAAVHMEPEWFQRVDLEQAPEGFGRIPPLVADETTRSLVGAMRREVATGAGRGRLYAESLSVALLSYALDHVPLSRLRLRGRLSETQRRLLAAYIRDRVADDLALTELAALAGLGTRQFSRLFREAFGTTPHRYVLNQRLDEAARRLATTTHDIAEVALSLGFSSQSHFASAFRARFGKTPRQYASEQRRR